MCYWEGLVITNVLAAWLFRVTVEIFLLVSPRWLGGGPEHEDAEDKQNGQPHLKRKNVTITVILVFFFACLCPFVFLQDVRWMRCRDLRCFWGHTFPTEVECSWTSSRKFPSKLQSAMAGGPLWLAQVSNAPVEVTEHRDLMSCVHVQNKACNPDSWCTAFWNGDPNRTHSSQLWIPL